MSKVVFPENDGISKLVYDTVNSGVNNINKACENCSYTIPNDFVYLNYLLDLGNTVAGFGQQLVDLYGKIEGTDKSFFDTFANIDSSHLSIDNSLIEERERLIK